MKQNRLFISDSRLLREKEEDFDAVQGTFLAARLIYRTDDERAESLREYLKVWDYLVMLIKYTQAQEQWLDMILAVVSRKEFQLHKIGFSASSTEPRCGDASLQLFNTYRTLLLRTMAWVMQQLEQPVDAVHQSFCASILAVALFRLPALAGHLVNAVCLPAPPAAGVGGGAGGDGEGVGEGGGADAGGDGNGGGGGGYPQGRRGGSAGGTASDGGTGSGVGSGRNDGQVLDLADALEEYDDAAALLYDDDSARAFIGHNPDLFQWTFFSAEGDAKMFGGSSGGPKWLGRIQNDDAPFVVMFMREVRTIGYMGGGAKDVCRGRGRGVRERNGRAYRFVII
jgi:hypothetical protein